MKAGLYSSDPDTAWKIDTVMEQVEDNMPHYGKFIMTVVFGGGKADAAAVSAAVDSLCTFADNMGKLLQRRMSAHGQKYIVGAKPSCADCKVISLFYNSIYNVNGPITDEQKKQCTATIAKYPLAQQYLEQTVPQFLGDYFASRPKSSY